MTDYENAAINAFKDNFLNNQNRGCFFHFTQCLYRRIQSNADLKREYENSQNSNFLNVHQLAALAFVPVRDVIKNFDKLIDLDFFQENEELLSPLTDYFEGSWIGRPCRNDREEDLHFHYLCGTVMIISLMIYLKQTIQLKDVIDHSAHCSAHIMQQFEDLLKT
jgi:hypothetical protein